MSERFLISPHIKIWNRVIGPKKAAFVIAEIGNNHNGDMELAKATVIAAARAGADAVKFQKRDISKVFTKAMRDAPNTPETSPRTAIFGKTYGEYRDKLELSKDQLIELKGLAHSLNMAFFATPFDLNSVEILTQVGMDAFKISSFDVNTEGLLECVAKQGLPVILSTGMSEAEERDEAVRSILRYNSDLIVLHCVSIYPTPYKELNLGAITTLQKRYPLNIGYSGHEVGGFIPSVAAVALGAVAVERHFTLDKSLPGPDHTTVSLDPIEFAEMVRWIRIIEAAVWDDKIYVHDAELQTRKKHSKSIVALENIPKGTVIDASMLTAKSPGSGIKPTLIHTVVGKVAKVDIATDALIAYEMLE